MTSFTETFSGSAIQPTDVAFAAYSFSSNLTLFWPQFSAGQTNVAARFMNMTATANSLNVYMPNATLVSVGYDVLMVNAGSDTFNVVTENGNAICTIAAGQAFYILLNNNTTADGTWQVIQFGVGTGAAVAAALAGAGLSANANLLQQNILGTTLSSTTTLTSTARAVLQIWNGGTGVVNLPSAASVGNGFFFPFANDGTGAVTVTPNGSDQIDGTSTSVFNISQSAFIVSTGTAWFTVGKGLQNNFSVTVLNLNVAGSSNVTETTAQAQSIIQQFTGILTENIQIIMPATPQIYFIYNDTTGAYTLTIACAGGGSSIAVAQGTNTILYCDGTNIVGAFSSVIGNSITLPVGTAGAPTLNFQGRTNTGLYSPASGQVALTAGGYEAFNVTSATSSVNYVQVAASSTGAAVSLSALGSDTNISFGLTPKGTGQLLLTNPFTTTAAFSGGTIDNTVIGGSTPAAIIGTSITGTGQIKGATVVATSSISTGSTFSALSTITGTSLISTVSTGTAPLTVSSTTAVANLNIGGNSATVSTINSLITTGTNTTVSGSGTSGSPYAINVNNLFGVINIQTFASTGTYTPTSGMVYCIIEAFGGGGGGGGVNATTGAAGGGGGAGGYSKLHATASTIGASQSVTIGAGGTAGANTGGTGGTGGTTSVGSTLLQATGGGGGNGSTSASETLPGGTGGVGSLGDVNTTGAPGLASVGSINSTNCIGAGGGNTMLGGAGVSLGNSPTNGSTPATNSGSGAGGAISNGSGQTGGVGAKGYVIITEFIS
jgi:hypothetical protein